MKIRRLLFLTLTILISAISFSCSGDNMGNDTISDENFKSVPFSAWAALSNKKIYFAHQSVGSNILDGIENIIKEHPEISLNIVNTTDPAQFNQGILAHSTIGENTSPQSKVDAFVQNIENGIGEKADMVALKLCYIDFNAHTDVQKVFEGYQSAIAEIKKRFPSLIIIHITVPLVEVQTGPKAWVKKLIGRPVGAVSDNIKRIEYNALLEKTFCDIDPIFDLSKVESTYPDGKRETFLKDGNIYYALVPAYTNDGGHLNELGKKVTADQFMFFLAEIFRQ